MTGDGISDKEYESGIKAIIQEKGYGNTHNETLARRAEEAGAVAVGMDILHRIAAAVKGKITILVDGGIRTGLDIFKNVSPRS